MKIIVQLKMLIIFIFIMSWTIIFIIRLRFPVTKSIAESNSKKNSLRYPFFSWKIWKNQKLNFFNRAQKKTKSRIISKCCPPYPYKKLFEVKKVAKNVHLGTNYFLGKFKKKVKNRTFSIEPRKWPNHTLSKSVALRIHLKKKF